MKKLIVVLTLLSTVFTMAVFAQNMTATVLTVVGKVEKQSGDSWTPLSVGDKLTSGSLISTGFKSSATIKFDGSVLELAPLSRLTLSQLAEQDGSRDSSVYLDAGKINANIKSSDNKRVHFTVNTPVATASVRGTAGEVDVFGCVKSTESVWAVQAVNSKGETVGNVVPVSKGMVTQVTESGTVENAVSTTMSTNSGSTTLFESVAADSSDFVATTSFASDTIKSEAVSAAPTKSTPTTATLNVSITLE
ncbi:MAG: FecR domain-containing protein [Treponemataceae bacterium]|nr:FecR domain-containing protein [Treponemataceae bacterium]